MGQVAPFVRHLDPERQTVGEPRDALLQLEQAEGCLRDVLVEHLAPGETNQQMGHIGRRGGVLTALPAAVVEQSRVVQAKLFRGGVRSRHAHRVQKHQRGNVVTFLDHQPRQLTYGHLVAHPCL